MRLPIAGFALLLLAPGLAAQAGDSARVVVSRRENARWEVGDSAVLMPLEPRAPGDTMPTPSLGRARATPILLERCASSRPTICLAHAWPPTASA